MENTNPVADMYEQLSDAKENLSVSSEESDPVMEDNTSEGSTETDTVTTDTETDEKNVDVTFETRLAELEKQREVDSKRLSDKDKFIEELKSELKELREGKSTKEVTQEEEGDSEESFWDDPESTINRLSEQLRIATLRIDENTYASTKKDYWEVVTGDNLKEAFAKDDEFLADFNKSSRPYETAYNYLIAKKTESQSKEESLKSQIRAELMKEMGIDKPKKEAIPNIASKGSSNEKINKTDNASDFMSVFRQRY